MKSSTFWTQIAKPAGLFLVLTLGLSACGGGTTPDPTPDPDPTPTPSKILGQLKPWTEGSAKQMMPAKESIENPTPTMKTAVNTKGQFDYTLFTFAEAEKNDPKDPIPFKDIFGACDQLNISGDNGLKLVQISELQSETGQKYQQSNGNIIQFWWLSNKNTNVKFSGKCLAKGTFDDELSLKKGWNVLEVTTDGTQTNHKLISQPTQRLDWKATSVLRSQSMGLHPDFMHPWMTLEKYKYRR